MMLPIVELLPDPVHRPPTVNRTQGEDNKGNGEGVGKEEEGEGGVIVDMAT